MPTDPPRLVCPQINSDAGIWLCSGTPEPWGQGGQLPPLPFWQGGQGGQQCPSSENLKNLTSFIKIIYTKTSPRSRTHIEPMLPNALTTKYVEPTSNRHYRYTVEILTLSQKSQHLINIASAPLIFSVCHDNGPIAI